MILYLAFGQLSRVGFWFNSHTFKDTCEDHLGSRFVGFVEGQHVLATLIAMESMAIGIALVVLCLQQLANSHPSLVSTSTNHHGQCGAHLCLDVSSSC